MLSTHISELVTTVAKAKITQMVFHSNYENNNCCHYNNNDTDNNNELKKGF